MGQRDLDDFDLAAGAGAIGRRHHDPNDPFADDDDVFAATPGPQQMLMRPRGPGSGSIFHETGIWPPPGAGSRLQDPLLSASEVELGGIVDDVMGSSRPTSPRSAAGPGASRLRGGARTSEDMQDPFSPEGSFMDSPASYQGHGHNRSSTSGSLSGMVGVTAPLLAHPATHSRFSSISGTPQRSRLALVTPDSVPPAPGSKAAEAASSIGHAGPGPSMMSSQPMVAVGQLVDVDVGDEAMPSELPPQYHTLRRDSAKSAESTYSQQEPGGSGIAR
ncbi:hypothetical protein EXIGLDRAFT_776444 [Exidia glandulosa HHB12029]|uniref:Uncharacterized protein n=1 Tax=Exidia glandulosa HHB12029 TaxID=1314781 RepID=A0A165DGZ4_EXIGL|nr:hypothetical protein EXIGLDRAFT_776444 [Exidia glandulosa HHB12029]